MNDHIELNSDPFIEKGSRKPKAAPRSLSRRSTMIASLVLAGALTPLTTFAASLAYLEQNAPTFIDKTKAAYGEMVNIAALLHDYDENMILAVIVVESEGNESATSHRGALGLMQLMPDTAKALGVKDPKDPFQNILAGTKYLKQLERNYGFASPEEALVAYNMGPSRAHRWLSQYSADDYLYVQKVMYVYQLLKSDDARADIAYEKPANTVDEGGNDPIATHFLLKPRVLSLATFPMTLPSGRKGETESE